ncbi:hypothetical protein [Acidianus sp. HS-5]|uniref:hypothetical protein n=1 Tax=Acidianus sp. HS-5 TaxID=2886040 RepID=UPI001F16A719|nr:hypothetical protein [Acidianus sp. HS-5]
MLLKGEETGNIRGGEYITFFVTLMLGLMIMGNLFIYNNAPIWVDGEVKKGYKTIRTERIHNRP